MSPPAASPVDRRSYWNERYRAQAARFGSEPNQFVREVVSGLPAGRALDAACGQGRNAVWLASMGHRVTAVDVSDVAVGQARALAVQKGVDVEFVVDDLLTWDPGGAVFDLVVLSYLQLPPAERVAAHRKASELLAAGGRVVVVAHHAANLAEGVGGPDDPAVLYDEDTLERDFAGLAVERNERVLRRVDNDEASGDAVDIVFVARSAATPSAASPAAQQP